MNKIDTSKKYRTRDGHEARVSRINAAYGLYQVFGEIKVEGKWGRIRWNIFGSHIDGEEHPFDLIEATEEATPDFDPTQNRVPNCLLTEKEREILRNWPHGLVRYSQAACGWVPIDVPNFQPTSIYRAIPAPERIVAWHNVYEGGFGGPYDSREKADYMDISSELRLCVYRIERDADGGNPEIFVEGV